MCSFFFVRLPSGDACSSDVQDGALFASLLEYLYAVQMSPDAQLELVRSVALRLAREGEEELPQQEEERFDQLASPNPKTQKKMMEWCEGRVRAALDEIDIIVTEVRKAGKDGAASKTVNSQKKQAVTRSDTHSCAAATILLMHRSTGRRLTVSSLYVSSFRVSDWTN